MRHRLLLALLGSAVLSTILLALMAGGAVAQTDPPASGDWIVADTTVVADRNVDLRGDLRVTSTGHLTLENVTLRVFVASDGEHGMEVQNGGTLIIHDGDRNASTISDACIIKAAPTTLSYYFICRSGSTLRVLNSFVTDCGHTGMTGQERFGLYIATDDATISGSAFDDCLHGVVIENGEVEVHDSFIRNSTYHGFLATDSVVTMTGTMMADNGYEGARVVGGTASFSGCQVLTNRNGMALRTGAVVTVSDTLVSGNTDGILVQATAEVTLTNCTIRTNGQYGIRGENNVQVRVMGSTIIQSTRDGLFASNNARVTSRASIYGGGVYGVRLNMNCRMTSEDDTFRSNTNSGIYLESTSSVVLVDALLTRNSVGLKAEDMSTVLVWNTSVEECNFEGYTLTDSDLELHDGRIINCTGGGIALSGSSATDWTVHLGNASRVLNSDLDLNGDLSVHGDLHLRGTDITFTTAPLQSHSFLCDGGVHDWRDSSVGTTDPAQGIAFSIEGTASGKAVGFQLEASGKVFSTQPSYARVKVPFELVQCTFRDGDHGLEISSAGVLVDRCSFIDNLVGVHVQGVRVSFENCTFSSSSNWHMMVEGGGHGRLANCTFDPAKVENAAASDSWSAWWTVHVRVEFNSGRPVVGAHLVVRERDGTTVYSGPTNDNGAVSSLFLREHTTTGSSRTSYTPHTFNVTFGTAVDEGSVDIDSPMTVTIVLEDLAPPVVSITSHVEGEHVPSPLMVLEGTAVDEGSGVLSVEARIGTAPWQPCDGTETWQWTYLLQGDGRYSITVRVRDLSNNNGFAYINITVDTQRPVIDVEVPPTPGNNSRVGSRNVTIVGYVDQVGTVVTVANLTTAREGTLFTANVTLDDGLNVLVIHAVDRAGNQASLEWWLYADLEAPPLVITAPLNGSRHNSTTVTLEGQTAPGIQAYYRVKELSATWSLLPVTASGNFSQTLTNLNQGTNTLEVMVTDAVDNRAYAAAVIIVDTVTPKLQTVVPVDGTYVGEEWLNLTGTYSEALASLSVSGVAAHVNGTSFSVDLRLEPGLNLLALTAKDIVGNTGVANLRYFLDTEAPLLELDDFVWNEAEGTFEPAYTNLRHYVLVGSTELGSSLSVNMLTYQVGELGDFAAELELEEGENTLVVLVRDRAGNELLTNLTLHLDVHGPDLVVQRPKDMERTSKDYVWVVGTVTEGDTVFIDGTSHVSENGTFRLKVSLHDAVNLVVVRARDRAGNEVSVERLVFMDTDREGLTGYAFLDDNCNSLLVVMVIAFLAIGVLAAYAWRGEYIMEQRERQLESVLEEDHIELDKPHMEPSSGHLVYDPTSPTGRKAPVREVEDEEFISMETFRHEMEKRGD